MIKELVTEILSFFCYLFHFCHLLFCKWEAGKKSRDEWAPQGVSTYSGPGRKLSSARPSARQVWQLCASPTKDYGADVPWDPTHKVKTIRVSFGTTWAWQQMQEHLPGTSTGPIPSASSTKHLSLLQTADSTGLPVGTSHIHFSFTQFFSFPPFKDTAFVWLELISRA